MVQFVPYFLGQRTAPYATATSVQKCIRAPRYRRGRCHDPPQHVLPDGWQFSFGDYFKRDAIRLAWSLLTKSVDDGGYGFDPERLWRRSSTTTTRRSACGRRSPVCRRSASSAAGWPTTIGRWAFRGRGPCSESPFRPGTGYGVEGGPEANEDRYIESGISFSCRTSAARARRRRISRSSARCRARTSTPAWAWSGSPASLQGVDNVYETDLVRPVIDTVARYAPRGWSRNHNDDVRYRIIADPRPDSDHHR